MIEPPPTHSNAAAAMIHLFSHLVAETLLLEGISKYICKVRSSRSNKKDRIQIDTKSNSKKYADFIILL